jgi:hypothetical protein
LAGEGAIRRGGLDEGCLKSMNELEWRRKIIGIGAKYRTLRACFWSDIDGLMRHWSLIAGNKQTYRRILLAF